MVTKKELGERIETANNLISKYRIEVQGLLKDINRLENETDNSKRDKKLLEDINLKMEALIETIVSILAGDSQLQSKAEIITDLLSIEVHHKKEEIKNRKERGKYDRGFLN